MEDCPKLSIVTVCFNQADHLAEALDSVLNQGYPNLEYMVVDRGSTDGSLEIIRHYAGRLAGWLSEPGLGPYAALNAGFARCTGEIMAWLDADDKYCPWAFETVVQIFRDASEAQWIASQLQFTWDEWGGLSNTVFSTRHSRSWFYRGWTLQNHTGFKGLIQQPGTFWRRALWQAAGGRLNETLQHAGDFELWARFWQHADLAVTYSPLAGSRAQQDQAWRHSEAYYEEAEQVLSRYRRQTPQHPLWLWLAEQLSGYGGRPGRSFGSRQALVRFDIALRRWRFDYSYRT